MLTFADSLSGPHEFALNSAWRSFFFQEHKCSVSENTARRLYASVQDAMIGGSMVRELFAIEGARTESQMRMVKAYFEMNEAEKKVHNTYERNGAPDWRPFRLVVAIKALYFFFRSLQDSANCAMFESGGRGRPPGRKSSMNFIFREDQALNPIRVLIEREIPGYREWFVEFRKVRNDMKMGRSAGLRASNEASWIAFDKPVKTEDGMRPVPEFRVGMSEIEDCFRLSAELLELVTRVARAGGASKLLEELT